MGRAARQRPRRLSEKLVHIRAALGLSQNEMVRRLGLEGRLLREDVSRFERSVGGEPPLDLLLRYARVISTTGRGEFLEALIDDDVDWAIYGPIDLFPFLGARHGKAAVLEVVRQIAENLRVHRFDRESVMLGVDSAASMMRYSLTALDSNKPISLRIAHFAQFRAGRLTNFRVLVDTFDLIEQTVGYPIHLPRMAV